MLFLLDAWFSREEAPAAALRKACFAWLLYFDSLTQAEARTSYLGLLSSFYFEHEV